jgi:hypothetical protein
MLRIERLDGWMKFILRIEYFNNEMICKSVMYKRGATIHRGHHNAIRELTSVISNVPSVPGEREARYASIREGASRFRC